VQEEREKKYLVGEEGNSEPALTVATSARPPLPFHKRERGREGGKDGETWEGSGRQGDDEAKGKTQETWQLVKR
jgi:hypothetical protein